MTSLPQALFLLFVAGTASAQFVMFDNTASSTAALGTATLLGPGGKAGYAFRIPDTKMITITNFFAAMTVPDVWTASTVPLVIELFAITGPVTKPYLQDSAQPVASTSVTLDVASLRSTTWDNVMFPDPSNLICRSSVSSNWALVVSLGPGSPSGLSLNWFTVFPDTFPYSTFGLQVYGQVGGSTTGTSGAFSWQIIPDNNFRAIRPAGLFAVDPNWVNPSPSPGSMAASPSPAGVSPSPAGASPSAPGASPSPAGASPSRAAASSSPAGAASPTSAAAASVSSGPGASPSPASPVAASPSPSSGGGMPSSSPSLAPILPGTPTTILEFQLRLNWQQTFQPVDILGLLSSRSPSRAAFETALRSDVVALLPYRVPAETIDISVMNGAMPVRRRLEEEDRSLQVVGASPSPSRPPAMAFSPSPSPSSALRVVVRIPVVLPPGTTGPAYATTLFSSLLTDPQQPGSQARLPTAMTALKNAANGVTFVAYVASTPTASPTNQPSTSSGKGGATAGGVIGGLLIIGAVIVIAVIVTRRRKQQGAVRRLSKNPRRGSVGGNIVVNPVNMAAGGGAGGGGIMMAPVMGIPMAPMTPMGAAPPLSTQPMSYYPSSPGPSAPPPMAGQTYYSPNQPMMMQQQGMTPKRYSNAPSGVRV